MTSPTEASLPPVAPMVHHACALLRARLNAPAPEGVVVGCGFGDEVLVMERALACRRVVGVDVEDRFSPVARASGCVFLGDGEALPFASGAFDFAAAFHSLEHVHDPLRALDEVRRVLRPGGWFYVGVPNRRRLVGYLGSFDFNLRQKIAGNLKAWRAQLLGKFRNELGAHAGFDRHELTDLMRQRFTAVELVTSDYVHFKYDGRMPALALSALLSRPLFDYTVAAHYALGQKEP